MEKRFEIGKAYQHNSGMQMFICGMADTVFHGTAFIAEEGWNRDKLKERLEKAKNDGEKLPTDGFDSHGLIPVSMKAMDNWFEIPKSEFLHNNTSK